MNNIIDDVNQAICYFSRAFAKLKLIEEKLQRNGEPAEHRTAQGGHVARRTNWSPSTNGPYYREGYAKELKTYLDQMQRPKDCVIPDEFRLGRRRSTRVKVNQAWLFLIDHLDPDGKYRQMRLEIRIRLTLAGVDLQWKSQARRKS